MRGSRHVSTPTIISDTPRSHRLNITDEMVKHFAFVLRGRTDAWGSVGGNCNKEAVTLKHYRRHLTGNVSLGIYPMRQDGRCRWFAIDIDHDDLHGTIAVMEQMVTIGINRGIYLERSKSKGYHILGFLSDWTPARDVRRIALHAIKEAGLPSSTEVFPKQDTGDGIRYGNYLNLPYFCGGNADGRRMILNLETLRPMPLVEWLEVVQVFPVDDLSPVLANLPQVKANQKQGHTLEEIVTLLQHPLTVGERRPTLVRLSGYLRYRGIPEEVAVNLLLPWAEKAFAKSLPTEEVERHIRGIYQRYGVQQNRKSQNASDDLWRVEVPLP